MLRGSILQSEMAQASFARFKETMPADVYSITKENKRFRETPHILLIGEAGSGKTTLLHNILWNGKLVEMSGKVKPPRSDIVHVAGTVEGVQVALYDSPGFGGENDEECIQALEDLLQGDRIDVVILCFMMTEPRLRRSHIRLFQDYDKVGINWERTILALTFADRILAPVKLRTSPSFQLSEYFNYRVSEWKHTLQNAFQQSGVRPEVVKQMCVYPTIDAYDEALPNGEQWLAPLRMAVVKMLTLDTSWAVSPELHADVSIDKHVKQCTISATLESPQVGLCGLGAGSEEQKVFWRSVKQKYSQAQKPCPIFGVLMIGETGSGKSTLVNNLVGKEVAGAGHTMQSETSIVIPYEVAVDGVGLSVYDTPGLDDSRGEEHEVKDLHILRDILKRGKIHLVIYCFRTNETRM